MRPAPTHEPITQIANAVLPQLLLVEDFLGRGTIPQLGVCVLCLSVELTHYAPGPAGGGPPEITSADKPVDVAEVVLELGLPEAQMLKGRPAKGFTNGLCQRSSQGQDTLGAAAGS